MVNGEAVWLVRFRRFGDPDLAVPVASKADGISFLSSLISDAEWASYHASLSKTDEGTNGLSPVRTENDPIEILRLYFGIFCNEQDRFVLEDSNGEVALVPLWRAGDELPEIL